MMTKKDKTKKRLPIERVALVLLGAIVFTICGAHASVLAQSGRRAKEPTTAPPATTAPAPSEQDKPTPATRKDATPSLTLIVLEDSPSIDARLSDARIVYDSFYEWLKEYADVRVIREKQTSRGGGVKRAKTETESFVVLVRLDADRFDAENNGGRNPNGLNVSYEVLAPVTAQTKTRGKVFLRESGALSNGRVIIGSPSRTSGVADYNSLQQAGRAAAERVMAMWNRAAPNVRF